MKWIPKAYNLRTTFPACEDDTCRNPTSMMGIISNLVPPPSSDIRETVGGKTGQHTN